MGILLFLIFTILLLCIDIGVKTCVESNITKGEEREFVKGTILVRKVYNKGFALNAFDHDPELVKKITTYMAGFLFIYQLLTLFQRGQRLKKFGLALLTAGAWGNVFDRWVRGYVIDFIGFRTKWKKVTEITFNFADFFIFIGSMLLMIASLLSSAKKKA